MNRLFGISLVIVATLIPSVFSYADGVQSGVDQDLANVITKTRQDVQSRANEIRESNLSQLALDLKIKSLRRQIGETEKKISIATTAYSDTGNLYSTSREYVYSHADFLLFSCLTVRAIANLTNFKGSPKDHYSSNNDILMTSIMCPVFDVVGLGLLSFAAVVSPGEAGEDVVLGVLQGDYSRFPKTVKVIRGSIAVYGALVLAQSALVVTYSDELNYRTGFDHLTKNGFLEEINKQIEIDNSLRKELAAISLASEDLEKK